jgi:hypothetical protein
MNDQFDERMDELLRRHLTEQLDGQVGAATERFRRHIGSASSSASGNATSPAAPLRIDSSSRRSNNGNGDNGRDNGPRFGSIWAIGIVGGALAAAVTLVSMRHTIIPMQSKPNRTTVAGNSNGSRDVIPDGPPIPAQQASLDVAVKTVDEGLVPLEDGTPARRLLRQRTDTLKWYDAKRKAEIEYTVPRQQTVYVGYNSH